MWPTASSVYSSRTNFFLQAIARNVSMWQLESDATNASSGSTFAGFPRYAGAAVAVIVWPPSKLQVWSRGYFWYENSAPPRSHFKLTLCSDMPLDKAARNARQARRLTAHGSLVTFHPPSRD